jgi:hypothetical protein
MTSERRPERAASASASSGRCVAISTRRLGRVAAVGASPAALPAGDAIDASQMGTPAVGTIIAISISDTA